MSGYGADGLRKASELAAGLEEILPGPDRQWFIERSGCIHDLLHVLTGYGQDWAGEDVACSRSIADLRRCAREWSASSVPR